MIELQRQVYVRPGFYLIRPEPNKNYGIGACQIIFYVIGPKGAVQWVIGTDWYPERARQHLRQFPDEPSKRRPDGWDIGYHSPEPHYEGQSSMECDLLPGGKCFYDGSSLAADDWIEGFICGGTGWLWPKLEEYYRHTFEGGAYPDLTPQPRKHPDEIDAAAVEIREIERKRK